MKISHEEITQRLQERKRLHDAAAADRASRSRLNLQRQREEKQLRDRYLAQRPGTRRPETVTIDGEVYLADDRDSDEFKAYVVVVESALKAADGEPLTVREIKARLGDRLIERWLFDALATSTHVLHIQAYIDRFAYVEKLAVRVVHGSSDIAIAGTRKAAWPDWV